MKVKKVDDKLSALMIILLRFKVRKLEENTISKFEKVFCTNIGNTVNHV